MKNVENIFYIFQNLKGQWDEYTTLLENVENLVNNAEHSLPTVEVETAHNHELLTQLNETKVGRKNMKGYIIILDNISLIKIR